MHSSNDNWTFEADGPDGYFAVISGQNGEYWLFKLLDPFTKYNRRPIIRRSFVDKFETREAAVRAAREHANMVLDGTGATAFPKPQRRDGKEPCGECRLQPGETCDICGARTPASTRSDGEGEK